jgi:hypothetical protein
MTFLQRLGDGVFSAPGLCVGVTAPAAAVDDMSGQLENYVCKKNYARYMVAGTATQSRLRGPCIRDYKTTNYKLQKKLAGPHPYTKGLPGCDARHSSDDATLRLPQTHALPLYAGYAVLSLSRERESSVVDLLREIYTASTAAPAPSPAVGGRGDRGERPRTGEAREGNTQAKEPQAAYVTCSLWFSLPLVRSQKKSTAYFSTYYSRLHLRDRVTAAGGDDVQGSK